MNAHSVRIDVTFGPDTEALLADLKELQMLVKTVKDASERIAEITEALGQRVTITTQSQANADEEIAKMMKHIFGPLENLAVGL